MKTISYYSVISYELCFYLYTSFKFLRNQSMNGKVCDGPRLTRVTSQRKQKSLSLTWVKDTMTLSIRNFFCRSLRGTMRVALSSATGRDDKKPPASEQLRRRFQEQHLIERDRKSQCQFCTYLDPTGRR